MIVVLLEKCRRCHGLFSPVNTPHTIPIFDLPSKVVDGSVDDIRALSLDEKRRIKNMLTDDDIQNLTIEQIAALNIEDRAVPMEGSDHVSEEIAAPVGIYCPKCIKSYVRSAMPAEDRWYVVARGQEFTGIVRGAALYNEYALGVMGAAIPPGRRKFATREDAEHHWLVAYYSGNCASVTWRRGSTEAKKVIPRGVYVTA
jgi:hypothetical protein